MLAVRTPSPSARRGDMFDRPCTRGRRVQRPIQRESARMARAAGPEPTRAAGTSARRLHPGCRHGRQTSHDLSWPADARHAAYHGNLRRAAKIDENDYIYLIYRSYPCVCREGWGLSSRAGIRVRVHPAISHRSSGPDRRLGRLSRVARARSGRSERASPASSRCQRLCRDEDVCFDVTTPHPLVSTYTLAVNTARIGALRT